MKTMMMMMMMRAIRLMILPMIVLVSAMAWAAPGDGLAGTAHDFSGIGTPPTGLCVFCHTPHKAQTGSLSWNHTLSTNTFSWAKPRTAAGTPYPTFQGDTYKGTTAKCLSCHDGSVAIGDIGFWNGSTPPPLLNIMITGPAQSASSTGDMGANHPVAMPLPWNNTPSTYNGVTNGPGLTLSQWQSNPENLGIRLFNDDGTGNITVGPVAGRTGIECSSCHDPHNGADVEDIYMLRGTMQNICSKCHNV